MPDPTPVMFTGAPLSLVLLPSTFPNAVTPGETLSDVIARVNAYRAPTQQIVGAIIPATGRHLPLSMVINGPLVVEAIFAGQYLQFGPTQYATLSFLRKTHGSKGDGVTQAAGLPVLE